MFPKQLKIAILDIFVFSGRAEFGPNADPVIVTNVEGHHEYFKSTSENSETRFLKETIGIFLC
jgi:hypothetical protein